MRELPLPCPPLSFDEPATRTERRRPLGVVPLSVRLEVRIDPRPTAPPVVQGVVQHRFRALSTKVTTVDLDAADLTVKSATQDGEVCDFRRHALGLTVTLNRPLGPDSETSLELTFEARPTKGLFFIRPTPERPNRRTQVWTQGAMEDHHHWFPCFDAPQHMVTTEVIAHVPPPFRAVSNGAPIEEGTLGADGFLRFHYRLDRPHALYLLNLFIDDVAEVVDSCRDATLHHFVPVERVEDARHLFARMPRMMDFFREVTGRAYPFKRYGHVFLEDFMWGGMENTTLTSLTDQVLIEARHRDEEDVERLFAHELAHQWFGDLIAPRGWTEIWLNESFATYFECLAMGDLWGEDDFLRRMLVERDSYLSEANTRYARAIVTRRFADPYVLFDKHAYEKGCLVLHTLRDQLGDAVFFRAVATYVRRCEGKAAETAELRRAFEDESGEDLTDFFEHMVYGAAHPKVAVTWTFNHGHGLEVNLKRQDETPQVVTLLVHIATQDDVVSRRVRVTPGERVLIVDLQVAPSWVALDPHVACLIEVDERHEDDAALVNRLDDPRAPVLLRARTCRVLSQRASAGVSGALVSRLRDDPSETVRIEAARALGGHRTPVSRAALLAALDSDAAFRVRVAAGRGLGVGGSADVVTEVEARLGTDESHRVRCALLGALGEVRTEAARTILVNHLDQTSPRDCIAAAAVSALGEQEDPVNVDLFVSRTAVDRSRGVRTASLTSLARLGAAPTADAALKRRLRETLEAHLSDETHAVRGAAIDGLATLGDKAARPALERAHGAESYGYLRRSIREAIGRLEKPTP